MTTNSTHYNLLETITIGLITEAYCFKIHLERRQKEFSYAFKELKNSINQMSLSDKIFNVIVGIFLLICATAILLKTIKLSYKVSVIASAVLLTFCIIYDYLTSTYYSNLKFEPDNTNLSNFFLFLKGACQYSKGKRNLPDYNNLDEKKTKKLLKNLSNDDDRPIFLFLRAKSDFNGSLSMSKENCADHWNRINGDNEKGIEKLTQNFKFVLIDNITSVNQIKDELNSLNGKIQNVWFLAHGTPTDMMLDDNTFLKKKEILNLAEVLNNKIANEGHIILWSCNTGEKIKSEENIATTLSKVLPGRTIWAPTNCPNGINIELKYDLSLKVNFYQLKNRFEYFKEKIQNICSFNPSKKISLDLIDSTAQIVNGNYQT